MAEDHEAPYGRRLDHIPQYSLVYGGVQGQGRVGPIVSTPLPLPPPSPNPNAINTVLPIFHISRDFRGGRTNVREERGVQLIHHLPSREIVLC